MNSDDKNTQRLKEAQQIWDNAAESFDDQADHGLSSPIVRAKWKALLQALLPQEKSSILDMGCGTGSLTVLLAELGHTVSGADISPAMIEIAKQKAKMANHSIQFYISDAAHPKLPDQTFSAIVCRHVLWALPEPVQVLERWIQLLSSHGYLLLIEGFWHTGAGLRATDIVEMMPSTMTNIVVHDLSQDADYWGKAVKDERYAIIARLK